MLMTQLIDESQSIHAQSVNQDIDATIEPLSTASNKSCPATKFKQTLDYLLLVNLRSIEFLPGFTSTCKSDVSLVQ